MHSYREVVTEIYREAAGPVGLDVGIPGILSDVKDLKDASMAVCSSPNQVGTGTAQRGAYKLTLPPPV